MNYFEKANAYAKDKKWNKAEKMLLKHIKTLKNVNELHFTYNLIIDYAYKQRKEDVEAINRCLSYCLEDISLLLEFKRTVNDFEILRIPSIDKSIQILKKNKNYSKLKNLLNEIVKLYIGTEKENYYKKEIKKVNKLSKREDDFTHNKEISAESNKENQRKNTKVDYQDISNLPSEELKSYFYNNDEWFCTLSFHKSRSKNFPQALELAKMAPEYVEYNEEEGIIYQATYGSSPNEYLSMVNVWDVVKNWKSSFININGEIIDKKTFSKINRCYSDKCRNNTESFCYGASMFTENPIGCHRAKIHESGDPWYKFGTVNSKGIFYLDKEGLKKETIKRLVTYRHCPALDIENIIDNINNLPEKINPKNNENWEYTTYFDTTNDIEYRGITKTRDFTYKINIDIETSHLDKNKSTNKKKRIWPWFLAGIILIFSQLWFVGLGCLAFGIYKKKKNN